MKTELIRKVMLVVGVLLIGVSVCVLVWLFLRDHKDKYFLVHERATSSNNGLATENRKAPQQGQNSDEEPLTSSEKASREIKSNLMSIYTEEQLATPTVQKILETMDSPEYIKYLEKSNRTYRDLYDFLESKGIPVDRSVFFKLFRDEFPTGEPADYEPEMRLKIAEMFLVTEPVAPIDPQAAVLQRARVVAKLMTKEQAGRAWFIGQFGEDWDGAIQAERADMGSNPALAWMTDVQRNAASIVAAAETAKSDAPETQASVPSWDLSSVMESPSASHSETGMSTTLDPSEHAPTTDTDIMAEIEKSLTPQPRDTLANEHPDTPGEIQGDLENTLKLQFSSERFKQAMDTLDQYGPGEGLRRLKENDPEVAEQVERHRNRARSEDSDKSAAEVSQ